MKINGAAVSGDLEALSAGGEKSGAAGPNSPALSCQGEEHMSATGAQMSDRRQVILRQKPSS